MERVSVELPDGRLIVITAHGELDVTASLGDATGYRLTLPTVEWHTRQYNLADQPRGGNVPIMTYRH
jgi:hypothetical protein